MLVSDTCKQSNAFQKVYKAYQNQNVFSKAQVNLLFQDGFGNENSENLDYRLRKAAKPLKIIFRVFFEAFLKNYVRFFLHTKSFIDEKT